MDKAGIPTLRGATAADAAGVAALFRRSFPDEDLTGLVRALSGRADVLGLVAEAGGEILGAVMFTRCAVAGQGDGVFLLGPFAVDPAHQRRGIGRALIDAGISRLAAAGATHVVVVGDPALYGRFGFAPETGILAPHPLPPAWQTAWQGLALPGAGPAPRGRLEVPAPWREPALWTS